jgi:hypothetical protein
LRNFTIGKKISDEEITGPHGLEIIVHLIGTMTPFVSSISQSRRYRIVCTCWLLEGHLSCCLLLLLGLHPGPSLVFTSH